MYSPSWLSYRGRAEKQEISNYVGSNPAYDFLIFFFFTDLFLFNVCYF